MIAAALLSRRPSSSAAGAFAPVIPLPRRWARAKLWAMRVQTALPDGEVLVRMRRLERLNRG